MQGLRKTARRLMCAALMALLLAALLPTAAMAAKAEASATTMRVAGTEGTVTVKNASGQNKSVFNNMQLYNGWTVETAAASYATLSLDSAKAIKLGAGAKIELRQNTASKRLELFVAKGNIFFDVSEELPADQTMNIRTSNMVCGIRGTMGEVKAVSPTCTVTYLLDGETAVINTNDLFSPLTGVGAVGASDTAAGTVTATGFFTNLKTALGAAAGTSGVTAPATDPTGMGTVSDQGGRAAVYIYEGNYTVDLLPGTANATNAMGTPALQPVGPGDRLELGVRPAFGVSYAQHAKVQWGDISGAAREYLAERPASLDRAVQGLQQNGSGDVAAYLQELTPENAKAVKAQEEQQAAANAADAAARNGDYQTRQANKVEQERGAEGAKVVDTWGTVGDSVVNDSGIAYVTATYDILLQPGAGGTLTADKTAAAAGETVTLTATPEEGYTLESLTVTDSAGRAVTVTGNAFTMPALAVTATAAFAQKGGPITVTAASFQYQKNSATMPLKLMTVEPGETVSTEDLVLTYDTGTQSFTLSAAESSGKDLVFADDFTLGTDSCGYYGSKSVAADGRSVAFTFTPTYEIGFETSRNTGNDNLEALGGVEVTLTLPGGGTETQTTAVSGTAATAHFVHTASQTPYAAGTYSYVLKKDGFTDAEGSFTLRAADDLGSTKWVSVTMEEPQAYTITPPSTLPNGATLSIVVNDTPADSGTAVAYAGDIVMMDYTYEYAMDDTPQDLNVLDENGNPAEMESRHLELDPMDSETGAYFCLFTMPAKNLLVGPHDLNLEEQMAEIEFESDEMKGAISSNALVVESYDDGYSLCQYAAVGETVKLTVTRNTGWELKENYPSLACMDSQENSIQTAGLTAVDETEGIYSFVVPQDTAFAFVSAEFKLAEGYYALDISAVAQDNGKGRVLVNGKPGLAAEPGDSITMEFTGATAGEAPNLEYWCFRTEENALSAADKTQTASEFGEVVRTYAFEMPAEDVVLSGRFARCYKVTVATPSSGQLTAQVGDFTPSGTVFAVPEEPLLLQYVSGGLDPVGVTIAFDGAALPEYTLTRRYDSTLNRYVTGFSFASAPAGDVTLTEATMYQLRYNTSLTAVDTIGGRSAETLEDTSFSQPGYAAYLVLAGEEIAATTAQGYEPPTGKNFYLTLSYQVGGDGTSMEGEQNSSSWTFEMPASDGRLNIWES